MSIQTATDKVANSARHLADDVLQSAQDAVQSTRTAANTSLEKAEEGVRAQPDGHGATACRSA